MNVSPAGVVDQGELQQGAEHEPLHGDDISTVQYSAVQCSIVYSSSTPAHIEWRHQVNSVLNVKQNASRHFQPGKGPSRGHSMIVKTSPKVRCEL